MLLVKCHKSRVLLIKWSQFFGGLLKTCSKTNLLLQSQLTRKVPVHRWGSRLKTWYVRRRLQRCRFWLISSLINSKATWWIGFFSCPIIIIHLQRCDVLTSSAKKEGQKRRPHSALGWIFHFGVGSIHAFIFVFRYLKSNHNFWNCAFISCQGQVCSS